MTNYLDELIHVKAYIKDDGTRVKEHWRGLGHKGNSLMPQDSSDDDFTLDETFKSRLPFELPDIVMNSGESGTVLTGGVETTVGGGLGENLGEIITTVVTVTAQVAIIAAKAAVEVAKEAAKAHLEAQKSNNSNIKTQYKDKLDDSISKIEASQNLLKNTMDGTIDKLIKTKDQNEYSKLFKTHSQLENLYNKNNQTIKQIKISAHNEDYKNVMENLESYQSNYKEVVAANRAERPLNAQMQQQKPLDLNSINYTSNPMPTPYMSTNPQLNTVTPAVQKGVIDGAMLALGKTGAPDAKEMWKAASHDFNQSANYINKNGNVVYSVSQLPSPELQQAVQSKLQEQLQTDDAIGVIFRADSSLSQAIVKSVEFQKHITDNFPKLIQGETIEKASTYFSSDNNLKLALGHADILYTTLDADGNLYALVFDTYDFNADENIFIRQARDVQDAGYIRNYYTINVIFIPRYQLEQLLVVRF